MGGGNSMQSGQSVFAGNSGNSQPGQSGQSVFGGNASNGFGQSNNKTAALEQLMSGGGGNNPFSSNNAASATSSGHDGVQLTDEEIKAYQANDFTLDSLPVNPPPPQFA